MKYYQFPDLLPEEQKKLQFLKKHKKAAIYSSGHIGRQTLHFLQTHEIEIICFINGPQRIQCGSCESIPIYNLDKFKTMNDTTISIVYCEGHELIGNVLKNYVTIPWYLLYHDKKFSYKELLTIDSETLCLAKSFYAQPIHHYSSLEEDLRFFYVNLCITQKCTLKCKNCNHLIPHFEPARHYDLDTIKQSVETLLQATNYIYKFGILGGEVFLHPQIYDILQFLLASPQIGCIEILTNGTVIPGKKLLNILGNEKIFLRISDYGIRSSALNFCIHFLHKNEILYSVYSDLAWHNYGLSNKAQHKSADTLIQQFQKCSSAQCYHIKGTKLYHCPYSGSIEQLNLNGYPPIPSVNLLPTQNTALLQKELYQLQNMPYINICDYCHGDCGKPIPAGIQLF